MKTKFKRPEWFDDNVPDDFQHKAQADLAMFEINKINNEILLSPQSIIDTKKELIYWLKHFINHAGALGHDVSNSEKVLKQIEDFKIN